MKGTNFPTVLLKYKKDDLIIKQGDYGISIYKIIEGKVRVYADSGGVEIPIAVLGPGEVIGDMVFLNREVERRSASIRAIEDTELEVWHPATLRREYDEMPPSMKYIADQALNRLIRMNRLIMQLAMKKQNKEQQKAVDPWAAKRRYYRKNVDMHFTCNSISPSSDKPFRGGIKDISLGGIGMEIDSLIAHKFPYKTGDEFIITTSLPNDKGLDFRSRLVSVREGKAPGNLFLGMSFTSLSDSVRKDLGFFLMS